MKDIPENKITDAIIGAAIEVHRWLGPGLLESAYETCLAKELTLRGIPFLRQHRVSFMYKGDRVPSGFKVDLWVQGKVIVELKAVEEMNPVYKAQLLTYLKLTKCRVGLLMNFNVRRLMDGTERVLLDRSVFGAHEEIS